MRVSERLVLPRMCDVIDDGIDLLNECVGDEEVEVAMLDFADAFKHMKVSP